MPEKKEKLQPKQKQSDQPGKEYKMTPKPQTEVKHQEGTGKLEGRVAIITGGDSGIGRAAAVAFAKEGASVTIVYLNEIPVDVIRLNIRASECRLNQYFQYLR